MLSILTSNSPQRLTLLIRMDLLKISQSAVLLFLLAHCTHISSEQKEAIKRVVVVYSIAEPKLDHFKKGITVFGNESLEAMQLPGLKKEMVELIRKETSARFSEVILLEGKISLDENAFSVIADPASEGMKLARKVNADAVLRLCVAGYTPAGFPAVAHPSFCLWQPDPLDRLLSQNAALVSCCCGQTMIDQRTNKMIASRFSPGIFTLKRIPFEKSFGNYSAETKVQFRNAAFEAFSFSLKNSLRRLGY